MAAPWAPLMIASATPLISVEGMCKSYRSAGPVLKDVSMSIAEGETVALIGPNGAGKSTLLKSLVGLHEITGGRVTSLGETFDRHPHPAQRRAIRRQIGFVFQSHGLVKRLSALSNVVHGLLGQSGSWRAWNQAIAPEGWRHSAQAALEAVRLGHKATTRVDRLSGGQAQRVAIARALVREPRLFIADEPAASLDPASGHAVMQQFVALARDNDITLIFTSHNMEHAVTYADRVIALRGGAVHFDRPSADLSEADLEGVFHG